MEFNANIPEATERPSDQPTLPTPDQPPFSSANSDVIPLTASPESALTATPEPYYEPRATAVDRPSAPETTDDVSAEQPETTDAAKAPPEFKIDDMATWPVTPLDTLQWNHIEPYTVIKGIKSLRDFSKVEHLITARVNPETVAISGLEHSMDLQQELMRNRIGDMFRPKGLFGREGFSGTLRDAAATVIPYDVERATSYKRNAHPPAADSPFAETALGVVYSGELRSARGKLGLVAMEAYYYPTSMPVYWNHGYNPVIRILGSQESVTALRPAVIEQTLASESEAHQVMSWALRHRIASGFETARRK